VLGVSSLNGLFFLDHFNMLFSLVFVFVVMCTICLSPMSSSPRSIFTLDGPLKDGLIMIYFRRLRAIVGRPTPVRGVVDHFAVIDRSIIVACPTNVNSCNTVVPGQQHRRRIFLLLSASVSGRTHVLNFVNIYCLSTVYYFESLLFF